MESSTVVTLSGRVYTDVRPAVRDAVWQLAWTSAHPGVPCYDHCMRPYGVMARPTRAECDRAFARMALLDDSHDEGRARCARCADTGLATDWGEFECPVARAAPSRHPVDCGTCGGARWLFGLHEHGCRACRQAPAGWAAHATPRPGCTAAEHAASCAEQSPCLACLAVIFERRGPPAAAAGEA